MKPSTLVTLKAESKIAVRCVAGCCALAFTGAAIASSGSNFDRARAHANTRGLFAVTIAALVAQGIGSSLSQGIGGSILKWFRGEADQTASNAAHGPKRRAPQSVSPASGGGTTIHAGMAFETHRIGRDGRTSPVDPTREVFHTGDRFQVHYRPTLPGRVEVFNTNPAGVETRIDAANVAAGQLATLGPYRFSDSPGNETLRLVLSPCSTPDMMVATRDIVKVPVVKVSGPGTAEPPLNIAGCADTPGRSVRAKTRSISKVTFDGATGFALDPVSTEERTSGALAAREVTIRLQHR